MAGQTTWNKAEAPAGAEPWNYVSQVKRALDTAGLVFDVASDAERSALTAAAPGGVLPVPTMIYRTDLGRYESWNGTAWRVSGPTRLGMNRQASVTNAGDTYTTLCTVTGTVTGGPVEIAYTGLLANGDSGATRSADVQILRDGTSISAITYHMPYVAGVYTHTTVAFQFDTTTTAGAHTWALQTRGSFANAIVNQQMTLKVTEHPS
jgi:hypothetical protein